MQYAGHVENGSIVLDEPAILKDGARVRVEIVSEAIPADSRRPLRGTPYHYESPFSPAVDEDDWTAGNV